MPVFEWKNVKIEVDEDGFMENPEEWTEDVAYALASTEDVEELTEDHWKLIHYLRENVYPNINMFDALDDLFKKIDFDLHTIRNKVIPSIEVQLQYLTSLKEAESILTKLH